MENVRVERSLASLCKISPPLVCLLGAALIICGCPWLDPTLYRDPGYDPDMIKASGGLINGGSKWTREEHFRNWGTWEGAPIEELLKSWGQPDSISDGVLEGTKMYVWKQTRQLLSRAAVELPIGYSLPEYDDYHVFRNCNIEVKVKSDGLISLVTNLEYREQACEHFAPRPARGQAATQPEPRAARPATRSAKYTSGR